MNRALFEQILNNVASLGSIAPLAFVLIYAIGTVFFVPTAIFALAAGALFSLPMGFVVALVSSLAVSSGGFWAGRYLSRGWIVINATSNKKIQALDSLVAEKGWKIVLLLRLSAILPFTFLNYGLGLSKISYKHFILASSIGMIPGTFVYVYLGSLAGKMVFEINFMKKSHVEWAMIALGLAATLVMAVYSTWVVKKAFQTQKINFSDVIEAEFPR